MKAQVIVKLKPSVLDPQGVAIGKSLKLHGLENLESVRQGKIFDLTLDVKDEAEARKILENIAQKVLANTVIEDYEIKVGL